MERQNEIRIFEDKQVRTIWNADQEKWYIAIVDVVAILTDSHNPQVYWRVLKKRLKDEGNETVTICNGFKCVQIEDFGGQKSTPKGLSALMPFRFFLVLPFFFRRS